MKTKFITNVVCAIGIIAIIFLGCSKNPDKQIRQERQERQDSSNSGFSHGGGTARGGGTDSLSFYSGEDLAKGLIFCQGDVPYLIPELAEGKQIKELYQPLYNDAYVEDTFTNDIFNRIKANLPNYFIDFKSKILSGDHDSVSKAYSDAANLIFVTLMDKLGIDTANADNISLGSYIANNESEVANGVADYKASNISKDSLHNLIKKTVPVYNNFVCAAINLAIAVNVIIAINVGGYIAFVLGAHTAVGVRLYIFYTKKFWVDDRPGTGSNSLEYESFIDSIVQQS